MPLTSELCSESGEALGLSSFVFNGQARKKSSQVNRNPHQLLPIKYIVRSALRPGRSIRAPHEKKCNNVIDFIGYPYLVQNPASLHTRNTGISSIPIPLLDFFLLSISSRSRRAFIRCLTSDTDERCSCIGSGLTGGEGLGGTGCLEGFEDEGVLVAGTVRGVMSRKDL